VTPAALERAKAELDLARQQRELLFWTIHMTLAVIVSTAVTIAFLVSLIEGVPISVKEIVAGAAIGAASAHLTRLAIALRGHAPLEPEGDHDRAALDRPGRDS
jgi:hypothetical protein